MKQYAFILSALLCASTIASAETALSYHYGTLNTEDKKIMHIQGLGEIVGGNSPYHELRYGFGSLDGNGASKADAYVFVYNAPDKNNEVGFGLGGTLSGSPVDSIPHLTLKIGGQAGYGWQNVNGESKTISTKINKLSYIITSGGYDALKTPTKMTYEDDTYVLSLTLVSGIGYDIDRHWRLDGEFSYRAAYYQFAYRNEGSEVLNAFTDQQDQWATTAGITYRF